MDTITIKGERGGEKVEKVLKSVKNKKCGCVDVVCRNVFQFSRTGF